MRYSSLFIPLIVLIGFSCHDQNNKNAAWNDKRELLKSLGFDCSQKDTINSRDCDTSCYEFKFANLTNDSSRYLFLIGELCTGSGYGNPDGTLFELEPEKREIQKFNAVDSFAVGTEMENGYHDIVIQTRIDYSNVPRSCVVLQYNWNGKSYELDAIKGEDGNKNEIDAGIIGAIDARVCGWDQLQFAKRQQSFPDSIYLQYLHVMNPPHEPPSPNQEIVVNYNDTVGHYCWTWILSHKGNGYALIQSFKDQMLSPPISPDSPHSLEIHFNSVLDSIANKGAFYKWDGHEYSLSQPSKEVRYYGADYDGLR